MTVRRTSTPEGAPERRAGQGRSLVAGALLAALLSTVGVTVVAQLWDVPLDVPFQYAHTPRDDEQDATLDLMLIKNVHETGWFTRNPRLNAPFAQEWAEWPMGGDLLAYVMKKGLVDATGNVVLTFNLFWLLTFPLTALVAFPVLRALRCSWSAALLGAVLFSLAPYHFRNGAAHENLAFYVGIPILVLLVVRVLGPDSELPAVGALRHREAWLRVRWLLLGAVLIAVTGIYYLAFLLALLATAGVVSALVHRSPGRLAWAALFGAVGLGASVLANLPTLLFRWRHAPNILGVPDRAAGVAEMYPLRIVELLSPVTAHRFGPFAALADQLYEPGRQGQGTAQLGLAAAIGLVAVVGALVVTAVRGDRRVSSVEARLGVVILLTLLLATKGGLNRVFGLVGLGDIRAWSRIAIVVAFAAIAGFCLLVDRVRVRLARWNWPRRRVAWSGCLALVLVMGLFDQASPALVPDAGSPASAKADAAARNSRWRADAAFVASLERRLPKHAMVFQLPVVDFPENGAIERLAAHDLVKEGYLHSRTLRWSAGGVRGRRGEWQWPTSTLPARDLIRGLRALGFRALMLDRNGYADDAFHQVERLRPLLGAPILTNDRLVAWDLRPPAAQWWSDVSPEQQHRLARRMLEAPRLYLSTDVTGIVGRGSEEPICATGHISLINVGRHRARRALVVKFDRRLSDATHARVTIGRRTVAIAAGEPARRIPIDVRPGTTTIDVSVELVGVRCPSAVPETLPTVSATLRPVR